MDGGIYNRTDGMGRDAAAEGGARPGRGPERDAPGDLHPCAASKSSQRGIYPSPPPPKKPFPPPKSRRAARKTHPPRVNALYRPGCVPNENGGGYGQRPSGIGGLVLCTGNELLPASARDDVGSPRLRAVGSCLCVCVCVCVCVSIIYVWPLLGGSWRQLQGVGGGGRGGKGRAHGGPEGGGILWPTHTHNPTVAA